jgi:peptide/nickel transport system substrate-binding protein
MRIRRAIALAIDHKAINGVMTHGTAEASGIFMAPPAGAWGLTFKQLADAPGYGPDPQRDQREAQDLMKAAGFSAQNPLRLKMMAVNRPMHTAPAILFLDQLRKIGIEASLDAVDISVWTQRVSSRSNYELSYWSSAPALDDPDTILYEGYMCKSLRNYSEYCDKRVEAMIEEQSGTTDPRKRKALVQSIDLLLQKNAVRPVLHGSVSGPCWHPHVKNLVRATNSLYTHFRFEDIWLDK